MVGQATISSKSVVDQVRLDRIGDVQPAVVQEAPRSRPAESQSSATSPAPQTEGQSLTLDQVKKPALEELANEVNQVLDTANNQRLQFQIHEATGRLVIRIVEKDSGDVIKEFPPEAILKMAERLEEMVGMMVDQEH